MAWWPYCHHLRVLQCFCKYLLQVYVLYVGLLLSALNRLPIKLPQKGAGRKHKAGESNKTITFDDVAGVDEAKEELQEIVVSSFLAKHGRLQFKLAVLCCERNA